MEDVREQQAEDRTPEAPPAPEEQTAPEQTPPEQTPPEQASPTASQFTYYIDYDIYHTNNATSLKVVAVAADSEAQAFERAAAKLEALKTPEDPFTWRYRGTFRKVAGIEQGQ
jgi:hypothetical protein